MVFQAVWKQHGLAEQGQKAGRSQAEGRGPHTASGAYVTTKIPKSTKAVGKTEEGEQARRPGTVPATSLPTRMPSTTLAAGVGFGIMQTPS